jgi:hypothetical protein
VLINITTVHHKSAIRISVCKFQTRDGTLMSKRMQFQFTTHSSYYSHTAWMADDQEIYSHRRRTHNVTCLVQWRIWFQPNVKHTIVQKNRKHANIKYIAYKNIRASTKRHARVRNPSCYEQENQTLLWTYYLPLLHAHPYLHSPLICPGMLKQYRLYLDGNSWHSFRLL